MSMSHQARASLGPKLNESGPSGKTNLVPAGTCQDVGQRHKIVPRRAEAVQEQDERTATSTLSICAARDPRPQPAYLFFAHERPVIS